MFTASVIGSKGGCAKTMTAIGLAVEAVREGLVTALIDLDPQATAANWRDRRTKDDPAVISAQASRLKQTLEVAYKGGADLVVIDTAGRNDDSALNAARAADIVLIPSKGHWRTRDLRQGAGSFAARGQSAVLRAPQSH